MKSYTWSPRILLFLGLAASCLSGQRLTAQEPAWDLENLAKHIGKGLSKAGITSVVVADFVSQDGNCSIQGHYLAEELSRRLKHNNKFAVIDRNQLSAALLSAQLSAKDLIATDSLVRIGNSLGAGGVATGTLEATPSLYSVQLTVRRVKDGSPVFSGDEFVKRPAYVDSLVFLDPTGEMPIVAMPGEGGVTGPTCAYCPPPNYTDEERSARIQGIVSLLIVMTEEGRAGRIAVIKSPNEELTKKAVEAVKKWTFHPAADKQGRPVDVLIPIEVTFRLY